jgi:3-oxoacyl-[acyl-carrier protein] reductase
VTERVAVVTGGSRRLGAHLARGLAADGFSVVVTWLHSRSEAEALAAQIGGRAVRADVSDRADVAALFSSVAEREGRIDVLVNNVGVYEPKPIADVTPDDWDRHLRPNLDGAFYCCHAARPLMDVGLIANLGYAGVDALTANPDATPYQVSKSALLVLTKSLAAGWAPIRANMISPGQLANSVDLPDDLRCIPAGRAGTLDDVLEALRFLIDADYVTGVNIDVAGGYRL